jgi:hypothetical protein
LTATGLKIAKVSIYGVNGMSSHPTWQFSIIAAVVLLSPVFAFLMAIAVETLIGSLMAVGVPAPLAVLIAGAIGWSLFHKPWIRPPPTGPQYMAHFISP